MRREATRTSSASRRLTIAARCRSGSRPRSRTDQPPVAWDDGGVESTSLALRPIRRIAPLLSLAPSLYASPRHARSAPLLPTAWIHSRDHAIEAGQHQLQTAGRAAPRRARRRQRPAPAGRTLRDPGAASRRAHARWPSFTGRWPTRPRRTPRACSVGSTRPRAARSTGGASPRWSRFFGNLRANKRLDRFTVRGRTKVDAQWKLYCLVHNIEKLAHHGYVAVVVA